MASQILSQSFCQEILCHLLQDLDEHQWHLKYSLSLSFSRPLGTHLKRRDFAENGAERDENGGDGEIGAQQRAQAQRNGIVGRVNERIRSDGGSGGGGGGGGGRRHSRSRGIIYAQVRKFL